MIRKIYGLDRNEGNDYNKFPGLGARVLGICDVL
jgi:hypothetical protein